MLNGTNFKTWRENIEIVLGVIDLDLALRTDKPPAITDESTSDNKREMERWERSHKSNGNETCHSRSISGLCT